MTSDYWYVIYRKRAERALPIPDYRQKKLTDPTFFVKVV